MSWGCASAPVPETETAAPDPAGIADFKDRLDAVGIGAPNPILPSETQRKATAREAAMIEARYELSSAVRFLILHSGITLAEAIGVDPTLEERVSQAISVAEISTEFTPDDGCVVRLRLSKRKLAENLGVRFR